MDVYIPSLLPAGAGIVIHTHMIILLYYNITSAGAVDREFVNIIGSNWAPIGSNCAPIRSGWTPIGWAPIGSC